MAKYELSEFLHKGLALLGEAVSVFKDVCLHFLELFGFELLEGQELEEHLALLLSLGQLALQPLLVFSQLLAELQHSVQKVLALCV